MFLISVTPLFCSFSAGEYGREQDEHAGREPVAETAGVGYCGRRAPARGDTGQTAGQAQGQLLRNTAQASRHDHVSTSCNSESKKSYEPVVGCVKPVTMYKTPMF